ncbi:MAG: YraN family protein [Phocaeicola sp.]
MALHNELGKAGEEVAANYIRNKGYRVLHRNWRSGKKELDIIAEYEGVLIVIEVKTRQHIEFGRPEEAVTNKKIKHIVASTDAYLRKFCIDLPVQFDIITVIGKIEPFKIEHIEEAFFPPMW